MSSDKVGKRILLTGATGFLGSHLLGALLRDGYDVVILKRSTSDTWRIQHLLDRVKSYDVDKIPIEKAFEDQRIDVVMHLATLYRKFDNGQGIDKMVASNIVFPIQLIECAVRFGAHGFINTGTFFEYDCSVLPVNENAPLKPLNLYAKTKLAFESILKTYSNQISTMTLRIFSLYGENDNLKLIPSLIQKAISLEEIELSDGLQKLDFVYVADVVEAYLKACKEIIITTDQEHRIFNIGTGVGVSIREAVSILEQHLGRPINKQWGVPSAIDIPIAFADISRARQELGWTPTHTIHDGLKKMLQHCYEVRK